MTGPAGAAGIGNPRLPATIHVLERGWLSSNSVLLHDEDGRATVIDTGYVTQRDQTVALVRHALGGRPLARIVNTHLHSDHCGGNAALQRAFGAELMIPPGHAGAVADWDEEVLTFSATGQQCERFVHDGVLEPGAVLRAGGYDWTAIAAPGHDPHAIVLWAAEPQVLISADALWQNGFGVIFPELEGESGFAEERAMLDCIASLGARVVIPGHGAPFDDVDAAIERARARLDALSASLERNARHAAKVLVKFLLLDVRRMRFADLVTHASGARYFRLIHDRYFRSQTFEGFLEQQVKELALAGVLAREGECVVNVDR